MKEFKLYNFDHTLPVGEILNINNFKIQSNEQQFENVKLLRKNARDEFVVDKNLNRSIKKVPKHYGEVLETATLRADEGDIKQSLIDPENWTTINDIVLTLSFLTGRTVYLEEEIDNDCISYYTEGLISNRSLRGRMDLITGLKKISELKLDAAFYNFVLAKTESNLIKKAYLVNSAFNVIYDKWKLGEGKIHFQPRIKQGKVTQAIISGLEKSLCLKIKVLVYNFLTGKNIQNDRIQDFCQGISFRQGVSAYYITKEFLRSYNYILDPLTEEVDKRIKFINIIRNSIAHRGDVPDYKNFSFSERAEITTNVTSVLLVIVELYFLNEIFKLNDYDSERACEEVIEYFSKGYYRGVNVFDETYSDFLERQEAEWLNNGVYV